MSVHIATSARQGHPGESVMVALPIIHRKGEVIQASLLPSIFSDLRCKEEMLTGGGDGSVRWHFDSRVMI